MAKLATAFIVVLALSGCGPIQREQARQAAEARAAAFKAAKSEATAIMEQCAAKRKSGELPSYVASVECSNPGIRAAYERAQYPYMDLIGLQLAARRVGAEKIDKGEITEAQMQLQYAELSTRITNEVRRREIENATVRNQTIAAQAAADQARAANVQATGALLQGLGAFQASSQPTGITCTTVGNMSHCQ